MCEEWRASFEAFYAELGPAPPHYFLDRINVNGNYEPGNCRWVSVYTHQFNRQRTPKLYSFNGNELMLHEIARLVDVSYVALFNRVRRGEDILGAIDSIRRLQFSRRGGQVLITCGYCQKPFAVLPKEAKRVFCSMSCATRSQWRAGLGYTGKRMESKKSHIKV